MSRSSDKTVSLSQRRQMMQIIGMRIFLSIHCNAANGSARGYEDFIYTNSRLYS